MSIVPHDAERNKTIFKIDPEFRDKIPPLTNAEFDRLKENILRDGEVYEPICVWNGTIVDGHNRWKVVQEHPEIPYKVREMDFADKWEAIEWMCKNQLGRRNLSDAQQTYLRGKMYEARKKSVGNTTVRNADGTFGSSQLDQNDPIGDRPYSTAEAIAREIGVAEPTVKRSGEFAAGLDRAEEVVPGFKDDVLSGKVNTPKANIRAIRKLESPEEVKEAIEAIRHPEEKQKKSGSQTGFTKQMREEKRLMDEIVADMYSPEIKPFTIEMLEGDIELNGQNYIDLLRDTLKDRSTLLTDENRPRVAAKINHIIDEIVKIRKLVE